MAFEKYYDATQPVTLPPCVHLRSKAMFMNGDIKNPDHPDEAGSHYCWCNITQHIIGPDHKDVDRPDCVEGRGCYCKTY